jgi:hypothetical protein
MKEMLRRAGRTFVQAAVGYIATNLVYVIPANPENFDYLKTALIGLGISATAAGLAAIMNLPKQQNNMN